jgi:hypothetical protein
LLSAFLPVTLMKLAFQRHPYFCGDIPMKELEALMSRHGEYGVQAILENWERSRSIRQQDLMSLEARWDRFLRETNDNLAPSYTAVAAYR